MTRRDEQWARDNAHRIHGRTEPGTRAPNPATEPRQGAKATHGKAKRGPSRGERLLANQLHLLDVQEPVTEYQFHQVRKFRFDFAWPIIMLAVEVEGLTGPGEKSRHTTNKGYERDCEKYNLAALDGWTVLRFTTRQVDSGEAAIMVKEAVDKLREIAK